MHRTVFILVAPERRVARRGADGALAWNSSRNQTMTHKTLHPCLKPTDGFIWSRLALPCALSSLPWQYNVHYGNDKPPTSHKRRQRVNACTLVGVIAFLPTCQVGSLRAVRHARAGGKVVRGGNRREARRESASCAPVSDGRWGVAWWWRRHACAAEGCELHTTRPHSAPRRALYSFFPDARGGAAGVDEGGAGN